MDTYNFSAPDVFLIDDLLDFSNEELFSSSATTPESDHHHAPTSQNTSSTLVLFDSTNSTDFTGDLCVPNDDVAELEWLSNFVDDSFNNFPDSQLTGTANFRSELPLPGRSRSKRSIAASTNNSWISSQESNTPLVGKYNNDINTKRIENQDSSSSSTEQELRRCTHCASEKTPQWRTGPLGPKTLCNACGVRFKSGRLVPEYRPAASPTFVLTQHSNSHRKVMELRRQKEEQQLRRHQHHRRHNFEVC